MGVDGFVKRSFMHLSSSTCPQLSSERYHFVRRLLCDGMCYQVSLITLIVYKEMNMLDLNFWEIWQANRSSVITYQGIDLHVQY